MRRSWLLVGLAAAVAVLVVAGIVGWWLGARSAGPPPVAAAPSSPAPIAPGAPTRLERVDLPADTSGAGYGAVDAALTADGRTLISIAADGGLTLTDLAAHRVERVATGTPPATGPNLTSAAQSRRALALAPDGRTVWVTDGWGRRVQAVDLTTRAVVAAVAIPAVPTAVAVAGDTVVVGDATGAITTIDAVARRPVAFRDIADGPVADAVATPDGRRVVVAADPGGDYGPGSVSDLDLTDPRAPTVPYYWPLTRPRGLGGTSMLVSPDSARAYVVTGPRLGPAAPDAATVGGVAVLDLNAGREVTNLPGTDAVSLALSPDGRRLYLGRDPESSTAGGSTSQLILDAFDISAITTTVTTPGSDIDSGPPGRPIGSLSERQDTYTVPQLLPDPDGRRLYVLAYDVSSVTLQPG